MDFWSDLPSSSSCDADDKLETVMEESEHCSPDCLIEIEQLLLPHIPPLKQKKLDVPYHVQRKHALAGKLDRIKRPHINIEKTPASLKTQWAAGQNG